MQRITRGDGWAWSATGGLTRSMRTLFLSRSFGGFGRSI
jgi:hypothetical protein